MDLVIWLPTYPNVVCSLLTELSKLQCGSVYIVCPKPASKEDAERYADDEILKVCNIIEFNPDDEYDRFTRNFISSHIDAKFFFFGLLGVTGKALQIYSNEFNGKNAFIFTEKPSVKPTNHLKGLNKLLRTLYSAYIYNNAYKKVATSVKGIFVTGNKGVKQLKHFGIPKKILFEIMYTHNTKKEFKLPEISSVDEKNIRFIYIGRFTYLTRGIDTLIECFNKVNGTNWSLHLVGGYGENSEEIIAWAQKTKNVVYLGEWKSCEVIEKMADYDVCISPTRIDGWRIQVNQAIVAGIGTITTTEAISDELIDISDTGIVIKPNSSRKLIKAVEYILQNPNIVNQWKKNTKTYRNKISNEETAKYINAVIEYCFDNQKGEERPLCPWMK